MIVLALDTALDACSVAVVEDARPRAWTCEPMQRGHQERLAPMAAEVMTRAGIGFDRLDRIAVTLGPGSFTGVRVGLAFAKGLSLALEIPCVGIGTLEALAGSSSGFVVASIEAKRGQIYIQAFMSGTALTAPEAIAVEETPLFLSALADGSPGCDAPTLVGPGAERLAELWPAEVRPAEVRPGAVVSPRLVPDPLALAALAATRPIPIARPAPLYLRAPDARTLAERAEHP